MPGSIWSIPSLSTSQISTTVRSDLTPSFITTEKGKMKSTSWGELLPEESWPGGGNTSGFHFRRPHVCVNIVTSVLWFSVQAVHEDHLWSVLKVHKPVSHPRPTTSVSGEGPKCVNLKAPIGFW